MTEVTIRFSESEWERITEAALRAEKSVDQFARTAVLKALSGDVGGALTSALEALARMDGSKADTTLLENLLYLNSELD